MSGEGKSINVVADQPLRDSFHDEVWLHVWIKVPEAICAVRSAAGESQCQLSYPLAALTLCRPFKVEVAEVGHTMQLRSL